MFRKWNDIIPTYIEGHKKRWAKFPMLNFSRRTPTLWKCFRWDSQKVGKIAHLGIFRHIGGSGVTEKLLTSKTSNIAISGPPRAEKWVFQTKHWHVRMIVHLNVGPVGSQKNGSPPSEKNFTSLWEAYQLKSGQILRNEGKLFKFPATSNKYRCSPAIHTWEL